MEKFFKGNKTDNGFSEYFEECRKEAKERANSKESSRRHYLLFGAAIVSIIIALITMFLK